MLFIFQAIPEISKRITFPLYYLQIRSPRNFQERQKFKFIKIDLPELLIYEDFI